MSTPPIQNVASRQITTALTSTKVTHLTIYKEISSQESLANASLSNQDVRQCLIYDSPAPNARLIGVEYMISAKLYETLPQSERVLWHSHVFEVKSGMLIMPGPSGVPTSAWEIAETKEMEDVVGLYGKTYHFWQLDRGDKLPMGRPELMMSLTKEEQCPPPGFKEVVAERDGRFGINHELKAGKRAYINEPGAHEDADSMWKGSSSMVMDESK